MTPDGKLFDILDETDDLLVINKSGDLVCHPTKGDEYSSLIGRLRLYFRDHPEVHPTFINRLDRETSGVILVAKNPQTHAAIQRFFQNGNVEKTYLAVVQGVPTMIEGTVDQPLGREPGAEVVIRQSVQSGGAASLTRWRRLAVSDGFSLLEVSPQTGRLHQIRVHLAHIGHPIVGDKIYGPDPRLYLQFIRTGWTLELQHHLLVSRQMLHASSLKITDPTSGQVSHWKAPLPPDMQEFLETKFDRFPPLN